MESNKEKFNDIINKFENEFSPEARIRELEALRAATVQSREKTTIRDIMGKSV